MNYGRRSAFRTRQNTRAAIHKGKQIIQNIAEEELIIDIDVIEENLNPKPDTILKKIKNWFKSTFSL